MLREGTSRVASPLSVRRRLRAGPQGRALGVSLAFAWLAYPFTLYTMNANANDSLVAASVVWALVALASPVRRGILVALGAAAKFGTAALAPLFATASGERRWRSAILFALAFCAVIAAVFGPFIPTGGIHALYDRTLGYQASRSSPFSVWGLAPSLDFLRSWVRAAAIGFALVVGVWPRTKSPAQVAALAAAVIVAIQVGATHWFYFYAVWFVPPLLAAAFAGQPAVAPARELRRAPAITPAASEAARAAAS